MDIDKFARCPTRSSRRAKEAKQDLWRSDSRSRPASSRTTARSRTRGEHRADPDRAARGKLDKTALREITR